MAIAYRSNKYERNLLKTTVKINNDEFIMGPLPWEYMPDFMEFSAKIANAKDDENPLSKLNKEDFKTMFNLILEAIRMNDPDSDEELMKQVITSNFNTFLEDGLFKLVNVANDRTKK